MPGTIIRWGQNPLMGEKLLGSACVIEKHTILGFK